MLHKRSLCILRSLLQTQKHQNQESRVLSIIIVKAFDSVSREFLFALLSHYEAPQIIVDITIASCTGTRVNIKVGNEIT